MPPVDRPAGLPESSFELGLGTGHLRDHEECRRTVAAALEVGYRHVDTARSYGNERAVGAAIERSDVERDEVVLATKVHSENLGRDDVREAVRSSRDALGVDVVDVAYVHWPAHAYDPDETLPALAALRSEGAIRHIGLSNFTVDLVEEARAAIDQPVFAVQVEMHPFLRQEELHDYLSGTGVTLVAHTPLCRGRVFESPVLSSLAEKHDTNEAVVSLAWLLGKVGVAAVPGARGPHLEANLAARSLALDDDDVRRIESIEETHRCVSYEFAPWEGDGGG